MRGRVSSGKSDFHILRSYDDEGASSQFAELDADNFFAAVPAMLHLGGLDVRGCGVLSEVRRGRVASVGRVVTSTDLHRVAGRCIFSGAMSKTGEPTAPDLMSLVCRELAHGDRVQFVVTGGSMTPFIRHCDVVEVAPLSGDPEIGDVVLARVRAERTVLHRVVRVRGQTVCLRGDAQLRSEGPFVSANVLGRATRVIRSGQLRESRWCHVAARAWVMLHPLGPLMVRGVRALRAAVRGGG